MADSEALSETTSGIAPLQRMPIEKVIVFRALQLGDMLCAVPALRALRAALPRAHITLAGLPWATQFAQRFSDYIDDFVAFPGHPGFPEQPVRKPGMPAFYQDMRTRRFDLALQMHGSGEISNQVVRAFGAAAVAGFVPAGVQETGSALLLPYPETGAEPLRLLTLARHLGADASSGALEFPLTEADSEELRQSGIAIGLMHRQYVCVHPGARIRSKCWPPEQFARVADALALEFGLQVVLTGSDKEADLTAAVAGRMQTPALDAAVPLSIGAMAALMHGARLLICNDTGVSHIAAGLRLPSVVVFSTADMRRWAPLDSVLHRCIQDPEGTRAASVLAHARELLALTPALVQK